MTMRRREFITLLGGAAAWPLAARAQQAGRTYRLGFFLPVARDAPAMIAFFDELRVHGFVEGQNLATIPGGFQAGNERIDELVPTLAFACELNGSVIVLPSPVTQFHRKVIVALVARYRLPMIYPYRYFTAAGGLMSYGVDVLDTYRRAAYYVDQVLKGAKPADLPVQRPTKFELVINLKTAHALGLKVPDKLLALADEVIE